ncbi:MAG: DUF4105 domain-containing protein [Bacteroidaceae bacterium]|nr:DUF4105 domain-containing protein [Bacteroidaceae bacterium]
MKRLLIYCLLCMLPFMVTQAEIADSSVTVSLITCSPGQEAYALYGHTALRVRGTQPGPYDVVFNYGVFDFYASNFVWRFVLGQTDYLVLPCDYDLFMREYRHRGSQVVEQVLNLTPYEADTLSRDLWVNTIPANRVYRYDFFRNNCTTKARDMIESHIDGVVVYPIRRPRYTYRQMIHQFTTEHPWSEVGNDLLLGVDADTLISPRCEMFLPIYMMHYADSAMIRTSRGAYRPLVKETNELLAANPVAAQRDADAQPSFPLSPKTLGWTVLALSLLVALWEYWKGKVCWVVDAVILTVQGLMGMLIAFMVLFSTHPTVGSNWQVWVLNPMPLFFLWWVVKAERQGKRHPYHVVAAGLMFAFLCATPFLHQVYSSFFMPLTLTFFSRSLIHLILTTDVAQHHNKP